MCPDDLSFVSQGGKKPSRVYGKSRQWHPTPVLLPGKIPWMEEPGGLQSMGSLRVKHN